MLFVHDMKNALTLGKDLIKNIALGTGLIASAYRERAQQAGAAEKDEASYPLTVFHQHLTALEPLRGNLLGVDVLEIGPGSNLGFGLLALLAGANSGACLDVSPRTQKSGGDDLYPALVKTAA